MTVIFTSCLLYKEGFVSVLSSNSGIAILLHLGIISKSMRSVDNFTLKELLRIQKESSYIMCFNDSCLLSD